MLYCDACGVKRNYGMKSRSQMLCKKCSQKGIDHLKGKRDRAYSLAMSKAKKGTYVWNKGKTGIFSAESLNKMRDARIKSNPLNKLMSTEQKRIKRRFSVYLARCIRRWNKSKYVTPHFEDVFEYSFMDFKVHLQSKFTSNMSWENYGEWHIDHIRPDSWFEYNSMDQLACKQSWALDNLQPMWAEDNIKKGNRYEG